MHNEQIHPAARAVGAYLAELPDPATPRPRIVEPAITGVADPLHHFPVFRTSDPEVLREISASVLGITHVDLRNIDSFEARINLVTLPAIGLAFGATSCDLSALNAEADFFRLQIPLKGGSATVLKGKTTEITERQYGITPTDAKWQMLCQAEHERLTLRLDRPALMQKLSTLIGIRPRGELILEPTMGADHPFAPGLRQLVQFLARQLDTTELALPPAATRELEQAVQIAFLYASRHSFSHLLEKPEGMPISSLVRRLEEFIEANWQDAITIERLTAEAGVSSRAIFRAFEKSRGYSPMAFAKSVRLKRARKILMSGEPGVTVLATAFNCNFASPGHFARDYREAFGELPSETLARAPK
jgi:AraC-like DNA-binding protein